jgi:hypothetical protein
VDRAARHEKAQQSHLRAAERHEEAVVFWRERGDEERADLERRDADIERDAAALEGDRARVERERPLGGSE